jgi:hypothetical protein
VTRSGARLLVALAALLAAAPVAAQPAPAEVGRPVFQVRRFDEDWSVLCGVDLSRTDDFRDRLKFVPLARLIGMRASRSPVQSRRDAGLRL